MESPKSIVFTRQALLKALLHACQHPTAPVYGALLAEAGSDGDTDTLTISAVVPLFHETPLGPLLEVAMTMISKACENRGFFPVGIYFGSDHYQDDVAYPHAQAIASNFGGRGAAIKHPILTVIQASGLANPDGQPLEVLEGYGSAFKTVTGSKLNIEELDVANKELTSTLASGVNICETDFNDHILTTAKWPVLDVQTQRD